ncbi:DUF1963 domain-containing protein [Propioniciclava coleopterorum]|uniref:DUF1963 domain-containing protein n=1 Tax=Propioniciclava coleopterorum TaxID=2714937 RepID=A0A6G7Y558_9ACTN|nr:YwqG family protein [Propioniciclava coleopterorum]QIK71950.1 DUF1963 domain-containing protein [Propioniciclava coleopterorum]
MDFDAHDLSATHFDEFVHHLGLAAHLAPLRAALRPTTYLLLDGHGPAPVGASKVGGDPDLPADVEWPIDSGDWAMAFAFQIDLAQVPEAARDALPASGLLSFFVGVDEPATGVEHTVLLIPAGVPLAPRRPPEGVAMAAFMEEVDPGPLRLETVLDLPRWATNEHTALTEESMDAAEQEAYEALQEALRPPRQDPGNVVGRLLGHAAGIGIDPREDAVVVQEVDPNLLYNYDERHKIDMARAEKWRHLLTIYSCGALNLWIWDAGYLQVLIHEDALAALDFENDYASVESS